MRAPIILAIGAVLWLGAVAYAVVKEVNRTAAGGPLHLTALPQASCRALQLGVDSTLAYDGDPFSRAITIEAIHKDLGAEVVRDSLLWNQIEPVKGRHDWTRMDSIVKQLRNAGIQPLLMVIGSPSWANGARASDPNGYLKVPPRGPKLNAWLRSYSDFLTAAVERYHLVVKRWEIWNEPNLSNFWRPRPDPAAYLQVYETLRAAIHKADPTAQVAVGGIGSLAVTNKPDIPGLKFIREITAFHPPLDAVAIHPYAGHDHSPAVHIRGENNFDDIRLVHNELAAEGEHPPLWLTEWGWDSSIIGKARQETYVKTSLSMIMQRYPYVRVATYFIDRDRPGRFSSGLLDAGLDPKPAAQPFRAHVRPLAAQCLRAAKAH